jgi:hypothetical protein
MENVKHLTLLLDGLVLTATYADGKLLGASGRTAKVESIEMNCAKATYRSGVEEYWELGDDVKWLASYEGGETDGPRYLH